MIAELGPRVAALAAGVDRHLSFRQDPATIAWVLVPLEADDLYAGGHPRVDALSEELDGWLERTGQKVRFDAALAASKSG